MQNEQVELGNKMFATLLKNRKGYPHLNDRERAMAESNLRSLVNEFMDVIWPDIKVKRTLRQRVRKLYVRQTP